MALQTTSFTEAELLDRVRGDLGARGQNLILQTDVTEWVEEALRTAAQQTNWYRVTDTVDCTSGTATYDLPTTCISLEAIAHNSLPLQRISFGELNESDPYWRQASSGTPLVWYRRGTTAYVLYPTPSATVTGGIQRMYVAIPAMPASTSAAISFPAANEQYLVEHCLFRGALKMTPGEGEQKVAIYERRAMAELERLKESVRQLGREHLVMSSRSTSWRRAPFDITNITIPTP